MSATLTWRHSTGVKTGNLIANLLDDINTMITAKLADANYKWQVASVNSAGASPQYLVLKRKDGSVGRFLLVHWATNPAGNNAAILTAAPTLGTIYWSFFPNGNTDTPLNLTAASGTILGNDAGCTKLYQICGLSTIYGAAFSPFYFDSEEAIVIGSGSTSTITLMIGGGYLFVDNSDNVYSGIIRGNHDISSFSASGSGAFAWSDGVLAPGGAGLSHIITNYGAPDSIYYLAYTPSGQWANHVANATDILTDTANSRVAFTPVALIGMRKCEGVVLKLRQIAHGPASTGPFAAYSSAGPTVQARQFCNNAAGSLSLPWFTNFKL